MSLATDGVAGRARRAEGRTPAAYDQGIGQAHSTNEATEQHRPTGRRGGGGKRLDQGKHG
jgi:hypothetical protein